MMLLAGLMFLFTRQWLYAALVFIGAFNCVVAALNVCFREHHETHTDSSQPQLQEERI